MYFPDSRPVLLDATYNNGHPERAEFFRGLAGAEVYSYARDVKMTPSSHTFWDVNHPDGIASHGKLRNWVRSTATLCDLTRIYVPGPAAPSRMLNFVVWYRFSTNTDAFNLHLTSRRTTVNTTQYIAYAGASTGYASFSLQVSGPDTFIVSMEFVHGTTENMWVEGISAHWEPLDGVVTGCTIDSSWSALSQAHPSDGRPDHAGMLKWLQRKMMFLVGKRPRPAFAKWWGAQKNVGVSDWFGRNDDVSTTNTTVVGKYRLYVGACVAGVEFRVLAKVSGAGTFNLKTYIDGTLRDTTVVSATSYTWHTITITTGVTECAVNEFRFDAEIITTAASGTRLLKVATISGWETGKSGAQLSLPGAETVPSAFTPENGDLLRARGNIHADLDDLQNRVGRVGFIKGLIYLAANRTRNLLNDCRYDDTSRDTGSSDLDADTRCQARFYFKTSTGTTRVFIRIAPYFIWWSNYNQVNSKTKVRVILGDSIDVPILGAQGLWIDIGGVGTTANTAYECKVLVIDPGSATALKATGHFGGIQLEEYPITETDVAALL